MDTAHKRSNPVQISSTGAAAMQLQGKGNKCFFTLRRPFWLPPHHRMQCAPHWHGYTRTLRNWIGLDPQSVELRTLLDVTETHWHKSEVTVGSRMSSEVPKHLSIRGTQSPLGASRHHSIPACGYWNLDTKLKQIRPTVIAGPESCPKHFQDYAL